MVIHLGLTKDHLGSAYRIPCGIVQQRAGLNPSKSMPQPPSTGEPSRVTCELCRVWMADRVEEVLLDV